MDKLTARCVFDDWAESRNPDDPLDIDVLMCTADGDCIPLRWVCGALWSDTWECPPSVCVALSVPPGSSYAKAVRKVRRASGKALALRNRTRSDSEFPGVVDLRVRKREET